MIQAERQDPPLSSNTCPELDMRVTSPEDHGKNNMTIDDMIYDCPNNAKPAQLADIMFKQCIYSLLRSS